MKIPGIPQLITVGVIAKELDVPITRVQYVLATRRHIKPAAIGGIYRLYDRASVAMVKDELDAIASNRGVHTG